MGKKGRAAPGPFLSLLIAQYLYVRPFRSRICQVQHLRTAWHDCGQGIDVAYILKLLVVCAMPGGALCHIFIHVDEIDTRWWHLLKRNICAGNADRTSECRKSERDKEDEHNECQNISKAQFFLLLLGLINSDSLRQIQSMATSPSVPCWVG